MAGTKEASAALDSFRAAFPDTSLPQYPGSADRWNIAGILPTTNKIRRVVPNFDDRRGAGLNQDTLSKIEPLLPPLKDLIGGVSDLDIRVFASRAMIFGQAQVDPVALLFINDHLRGLSQSGEERFAFLRSQDRARTQGVPLLTEKDKAESLKQKGWYRKRFQTKDPAESLRTVSLSLSLDKDVTKTVLISSIGSGNFVSDEIKANIAMSLWGRTSGNQLKAAAVNDPSFDTVEKIGLVPGIVGPFINASYSDNIAGIFYVRNSVKHEHPVEVALSPYDSLIMRKDNFETMLAQYARGKLPRVRYAVLSGPSSK